MLYYTIHVLSFLYILIYLSVYVVLGDYMLLFSYTVKIYMTQQIMRFALNVIINYTKLCDTVYYSINVLELFLALDMTNSSTG